MKIVVYFYVEYAHRTFSGRKWEIKQIQSRKHSRKMVKPVRRNIFLIHFIGPIKTTIVSSQECFFCWKPWKYPFIYPCGGCYISEYTKRGSAPHNNGAYHIPNLVTVPLSSMILIIIFNASLSSIIIRHTRILTSSFEPFLFKAFV